MCIDVALGTNFISAIRPHKKGKNMNKCGFPVEQLYKKKVFHVTNKVFSSII